MNIPEMNILYSFETMSVKSLYIYIYTHNIKVWVFRIEPRQVEIDFGADSKNESQHFTSDEIGLAAPTEQIPYAKKW